MSFDLNITVNGNRCKQYNHQGKTFIEAKNGSEYVIEIKNNHWKRVLAVGSVDGLNILTGKSASDTDTGYIIGAYSSERIKGFRFSDNEWAMFKFGYKFYGNTYAQSKEDGSEKNCGVIGLRIFYEQEPVVTYTAPIIINNPPPYNPWPNWPYFTTTTNAISGACSGGGGTGLSAGNAASYTSNVNYSCNSLGSQDMMDYSTLKSSGPSATNHNTRKYDATLSSPKKSKKRSAGGGQSANFVNCSQEIPVASASPGVNYNTIDKCGLINADVDDSLDFMPAEYSKTPKADFDMGTEWGRKEYSKVHNVTFERGCLAQSFDIYYASREALIGMGVPIVNQLTVNIPQSFPNGYAQPPKNWNG